MTDYSDIGLNSNLQSVNSIPANSVSFVNSVDFEADYDRGIVTNAKLQNLSITSAKIGTAAITSANIATAAITNANIATAAIGTANIGTLSFNEIHGGTGVFGGTNSGSGVVSVLNNAGSEVVRLDGTGITVRNGSINIQNSSGSSIIDSSGLVSLNNFRSNSVVGSLLATSGTSYSDIVNATFNIILDRSTKVFFTYSSSMNNTGVASGYVNTMALNIAGTEEVGPVVIGGGHDSGGGGILAYTQSASSIQTIGPGTVNVKLIGKTSNSGGEARFNQPTLTYVILGN